MSAIRDLRHAILSGQTTSEAATRAALAAAHASPHNAFVEIHDDHALTQARAIDATIARGEAAALPLAGVPIAIKDNLCTAWGRTTAGSRILSAYKSPYTATAVERLMNAGAVIFAKTNLDEFAMGSSGENSAFGPTTNPWDVSRVPGGSSSGSAAAVAAGVAPAALGSDTGGSIRQPASHCGLVGLKPTYGRVSRYGLVAYASSLDQIGPLTTSVTDAAIILSAISGHDQRDATSAIGPAPDFTASLDEPVRGLRIGVPREAQSQANHPAVAAALDLAIDKYRQLGAEITTIDLPTAEYGVAAYYIVATAEASSNLARFDGVRYGTRAALGEGEGLLELYCKSRSEGFGAEVKKRILLGTHVLSSGYYDAYYNTALKARRKLKADFDRAFTAAGCHAVLMPASPGPAFRLGEKTTDPLAMYLEDIYTVSINLAGLPAITLPVSSVAESGAELPIGMQLIGPAFAEADLLRVARMLERVSGWEGRTAPLKADPSAARAS